MWSGRTVWLGKCATAVFGTPGPIPEMHEDRHPVNHVNHVQIASSDSLDRINMIHRILVLPFDGFPAAKGCPARPDDPFAQRGGTATTHMSDGATWRPDL